MGTLKQPFELPMTVTRWLVTRSLPDPVVASEDPAYNTIRGAAYG